MIRVNIYNEGRVPFVNVKCPVENYPISEGIFSLLKKMPNVMIERWTGVSVLNLKSKTIPQEQKAEEKKVEIKEIAEIKEELKTSQTENNIEAKVVDEKPYKPLDTSNLRKPSDLMEERMAEIMGLKPTPDYSVRTERYVEENNIVANVVEAVSNELNEEESVDAALDAMDFSEEETNFDVSMASVAAEPAKEFKTYTKKSLAGKTKAEMKEILKERGFTDGPFCPRYHDTLEKLTKKILDSQKI